MKTLKLGRTMFSPIWEEYIQYKNEKMKESIRKELEAAARQLEVKSWNGEVLFVDFIHDAMVNNYKYLVRCEPFTDEPNTQIGAAFRSEEQLIERLLAYSKAGYSYRIELLTTMDDLIAEKGNS